MLKHGGVSPERGGVSQNRGGMTLRNGGLLPSGDGFSLCGDGFAPFGCGVGCGSDCPRGRDGRSTRSGCGQGVRCWVCSRPRRGPRRVAGMSGPWPCLCFCPPSLPFTPWVEGKRSKIEMCYARAKPCASGTTPAERGLAPLRYATMERNPNHDRLDVCGAVPEFVVTEPIDKSISFCKPRQVPGHVAGAA